MAESASEQLLRLKATRPQKGYAAQQKWDKDNDELIKALTERARLENKQLGTDIGRKGEAANYLKSPEHRAYLEQTNPHGLAAFGASSIINGPLAGLIPGFKASPGTSKLGRVMTFAPYGAELGYAGYSAANQPTPEQDDPRAKDIAAYNKALDIGWGAGSVLGGLKNATAYSGAPPKSSGVAVPVAPTPDAVSDALKAADVTPPQALKGSGMTPTDASKELVKELGLTPADKRDENRKILQRELPKAKPEVVDRILKMHPTFNPGDLAGSVDKLLRTPKALAIPVGVATGLGLLGSYDGSEGKSSDPRDLPSRKAVIDALKTAGQQVPYFVPYLGEGLMTKDALESGQEAAPKSFLTGLPALGGSPNAAKLFAEEAKGRDQAQAEQEAMRQKADEAKREKLYSAMKSQAPDETYAARRLSDANAPPVADDNHLDDLPEHEKNILKNKIDPARAAAYLMPHIRAGAEALKRGEDFWGGTEQYERERRALETFYNAANRQAKAASAIPSPSDPAPAPDNLPAQRARGGKVLKSEAVRQILKQYATR